MIRMKRENCKANAGKDYGILGCQTGQIKHIQATHEYMDKTNPTVAAMLSSNEDLMNDSLNGNKSPMPIKSKTIKEIDDSKKLICHVYLVSIVNFMFIIMIFDS